MRSYLKILPLLFFLLVTMIYMVGCNIFGFTNDVEKSNIEKAEDAIREGNYAQARKELADAVKDSVDAMALYLNAKAAFLESGVDLARLVDLVEGQENIASGDKLAILETIDQMDDTEQTTWYRANMEVRANLSKIWKEKTVGILKKDDIALGYTISNMMSGVLGLRDTNRDGEINAKDFQIDMNFISNIGISNVNGFQITEAKIKDEFGNIVIDEQTGEPVVFEGLTVFLGDWTGKSTPTFKRAAHYTYLPDDINPLIAFALSLLDEGAEGILYLLKDKDLTAFEVEKIEQYIDEIAVIINYYWYDDGIDNDRDGRIDEETIDGQDNDNDGLVDEDSDYHPMDPTPEENTQYHHIWEKWIGRN